ncbi:MAG: SDR family oxidoreductase [Bacteroidia bacterium]|nr:SDR family oxidoreductase [Bacteroidia bacterium]
MIISLHGKRALVCGSTQGIGKAIAMELAKSGATITLMARDEQKLKTVLTELNNIHAADHHYLVADFTASEQLREIIQTYTASNSIQILINNTGGPPAGPIVQANTEAFLNAYQQHLICNHILMQSTLQGMKDSGYGRIINIISTSVKQPLANLGVSNTTRAAVANWSKTLATELAPFGITVNNVLPGATKTLRLETIAKNKAAKTGVQITDVETEMLHEIPAGRFATPDEIAYAAVFLASPFASYINGINVPVDGGRTACL